MSFTDQQISPRPPENAQLVSYKQISILYSEGAGLALLLAKLLEIWISIV